MRFNEKFKNTLITGVQGTGKNLLAKCISTDFIEINDIRDLEGVMDVVAVMHSDVPVKIQGYMNIHCNNA